MNRVILIVEDEDLIRVIGVEYLQDVGFEVIEAIHAAHALATIGGAQRVDLVFTDVHMPGDMNGHALAKWLEHHRPGLPVILTSGLARPAVESTKLRRFIPKPYALPEIERHIRELLS